MKLKKNTINQKLNNYWISQSNPSNWLHIKKLNNSKVKNNDKFIRVDPNQ